MVLPKIKNHLPKIFCEPLFTSVRKSLFKKKNDNIAITIAPVGESTIVIKSAKLLNLFVSIASGIARIKHIIVTIKDAFFLDNLDEDIIASTGPSSIFIDEDIAAKITLKKNKELIRFPWDMELNTFGRVINNRLGPDVGSRLKANTAGIITKAASSAAMVSKNAVLREEDTISKSSFA